MRTIIISALLSSIRRYAHTPLRRFVLPTLAFGLIWAAVVQAQVGSSISSDGSAPNDNAMLDVKSPTSGAGKGILIPRITVNQRTNANTIVDGGLLDNSGNLRGGAAQGLMVYQTDGAPGLYVNTNAIATPAWVYLGDVTGFLASNVWAAADSTTNYLPRTGGTMSGTLNMGAQIVTNVAHVDFSGNAVSVGRGANGYAAGAAVGYLADGYNNGAAVGPSANGANTGAALGYNANGANFGAALGNAANGYLYGTAVGRQANGYDYGAAVGRLAKGTNIGAAVGNMANGSDYGAALGREANGYNVGVAVGCYANGKNNGVAVGYAANGTNYGVAMGWDVNGSEYGAAMGYYANGAQTNVAIGVRANAGGGTERIAIGHNVTNTEDNSARIRGSLYLDGGTNIFCRTNFITGAWFAKAFEIDHPLDPANKILRHFCLEGPQVWNVYAGNAQLKNGQAVVQLPDYYSALNLVGSEIYSLTVVGALAQIAVGAEVNENQFTIIGDKDVKVSWTIKVLRNDPGCLEDLRRRPVEQMKNEIR